MTDFEVKRLPWIICRIARVTIKWSQESQSQRWEIFTQKPKSDRFDDITLLVLTKKEGPWAQECRWHIWAGTCKRMTSSLELPEVRQDCQLPDISPVKPGSDFWPPKRVIVQSLSQVQLLVTLGTAAHQASLSFPISQGLLKLKESRFVLFEATKFVATVSASRGKGYKLDAGFNRQWC